MDKINAHLDIVAYDGDGNERIITTVVGDAITFGDDSCPHYFIEGGQLGKARRALAKAGLKTRFNAWWRGGVVEIDRLPYGLTNAPVASDGRTFEEGDNVAYVVPREPANQQED